MRGRIMSAAALGAAGVVAVRSVGRRRESRAVARAMNEPGPVITVRGESLRLPIVFQRSDGFAAIVSADLARVEDVLPTSELHPVRAGRDRAALLVIAFRHHEPTATGTTGETVLARPYGEVLIGPLVTPRPAPPVLPLIAGSAFRMGAFVLYLPVTSRLALDAGRVWNYPKFVADMAFTDDDAERAVTLGEDGRSILTLRVRPSGRPVVSRLPTTLYSELDGRLLEMPMPTVELHQMQLGRAGGALELGDHPVANALRGLGVDGAPLGTMTILHSRFAMTAGRTLGPARPYTGYVGGDRDFGRYTVRHAGQLPIDQYAGLTPDEWTSTPSELPGPVAQPRSKSPGTRAPVVQQEVVATSR